MEEEYLLGKNNYCLTTHTMQKEEQLFNLVGYKSVIKSFTFQTEHCEEKKKLFDYEKLIFEGNDG